MIRAGNRRMRAQIRRVRAVMIAGLLVFCSVAAVTTLSISTARAAFTISKPGLTLSLLDSVVGVQSVQQPIMVPLANGNVVVAAPDHSTGDPSHLLLGVGSVELFDGTTDQRISLIEGAAAVDQVGGTVTPLSNGNFVVTAATWHDANGVDVGAAMLCSGITGCAAAPTSTNALHGSHSGDFSDLKVIPLANGNYLVANRHWTPDGATFPYAVTWCSGDLAANNCIGAITPSNSLIGMATGSFDLPTFVALPNGSYVVAVPDHPVGAVAQAGVVTWCPATGCVGTFGAPGTPGTLLGTNTGDVVGSAGISVLPATGDFLVRSVSGAVTWCSESAGCDSVATPTNTTSVGSDVTVLANGRYVAGGGKLLCNDAPNCSTTGIAWNGPAGDLVVPLTSGDYVVRASFGAWVLWCSGTTGCKNNATAADFLHGAGSDGAGDGGIVALASGGYVVSSRFFGGDLGAVTTCGAGGCRGALSASNSLVGSRPGDEVGWGGVVALADGAFVVMSPNWGDGITATLGAVAWCSLTVPCVGPMQASRVLHGSSVNDQVGKFGPGTITPLDDGSYLVKHQGPLGGSVASLTYCQHGVGCSGVITPSNSFVNDKPTPGSGVEAWAMPHGEYVVDLVEDNFPAVISSFHHLYVRGAGPTVGLMTQTPQDLDGPDTPVANPAADSILFPRQKWLARVLRHDVTPVTPTRLVDTRSGPDYTTFDGQYMGIGIRGSDSITPVTVAGRGPTPLNARAVQLNVTVAGSVADGFVTVFPCGSARPNASSVNYGAGQIISNSVTVQPGPDGTVCFYTHTAVHLIVDLDSMFLATTGYVGNVPTRLVDTRSGSDYTTFDGQYMGIGIRGSDSITPVTVAGRGPTPLNARAVQLNVTVAGSVADGFVTVFPCGSARPNASSVNYGAGQIISNSVTVQPGPDGTVCFYTHTAVHLIVDLEGHYATGSAYAPMGPLRLLDTRSGTEYRTFDGQYQGIGVLRAGSILALTVGGRGSVPATPVAVQLNIAVVGLDQPGFITVWACNSNRPQASNVNYSPHAVVANGVTTEVNSSSRICIYVHSDVDLVVDLQGVF